MLAHVAAVADVDKVANRRILLSAECHNLIADRLQAADIRELVVRERLVETFRGEIEIEDFR